MAKNNITFLHDMLAKMDARLDEMHEVQVQQKASLDEHIRRTALLEEQMGPLTKQMNWIEGVGLFIGFVALLATIYAAVN